MAGAIAWGKYKVIEGREIRLLLMHSSINTFNRLLGYTDPSSLHLYPLCYIRLSSKNIEIVSVDKLHTFLPPRICLGMASNIRIKDIVLRVRIIICRPHTL